MHVTVSKTLPAAIRAEIEQIVRAGFEGVESSDVEVHVKARTRDRRAYYVDPGRNRPWIVFRRRGPAVEAARAVGGTVVPYRGDNPKANLWGGRTYNGVPGIARVEPGTRYLVTINVPADPRRLTRYPYTHKDPRLKTGPLIPLETWQDELFHIAAHEARHVHQFRHDLPKSELECERWAAGTLLAARTSLRGVR